MVIAEGGALMLIETEQHAKARGARILARLMGAGFTSDGYDAVEPDPSGERAGDAISRAIELAGLTPADIDHINAHAAGTVAGDLAEAKAIGRALGDRTPAVYAPKAALGHSLGASGGGGGGVDSASAARRRHTAHPQSRKTSTPRSTSMS